MATYQMSQLFSADDQGAEHSICVCVWVCMHVCACTCVCEIYLDCSGQTECSRM